MDYGERFNYGKIKDDFDCPKPNGYYSSTHTSSDLGMSMSNKELEEENERLKEYIILLEEKNDFLEKTNETITKESKENKKNAFEKSKENERKAKVFDKLCKLLYGKIICNRNYKDIYWNFKGGPVKVGQWLEGGSVELTKLTDKETVKLLNLLLMGMGSEYYVEWFGYTGLKDKDDGEEKVTIRE